MVVKYCDYSGADGVIGTQYNLIGVGIIDQYGSINYVPSGSIDMDDIPSMLTYLDTLSDGTVKYSKDEDTISVFIGKAKSHIATLEFQFLNNDGFLEQSTIYFTQNNCHYAQDVEVIRGCMDSTASNYNSLATEDDDSCVYTPISSPDLLRDKLNDFNLCKTRQEHMGKVSCCELVVGRFVNRVTKIAQRVYNNTTEIAPESPATATLDFSEYDLSTLTNGMNIEVVIVFVDGSVVVLTNFFGDLFGINEVDFLTLLALNVNLDNPDVSCVYPGSGFIIELVAAPDLGASINLAEVKINFVDYLDLGTSVDTGQVFLPGKPAYFGGKAFIPDCNNFNRMYVADPTGATATLELNHSFTSLIIFPGTDIPVSTAWASAFPHAGYRSYKRIVSAPTIGGLVGSQGLSICKDPLSSYHKVVFYTDNSNSTLQARYPNGTIDICPGILPLAADKIHAVSAFGDIVRIFILDTYGQAYGFVDYAGIGAWSIIPPVGSGSITYLAGGADVEYIESTEDFIFATGSAINRVNGLGVLDAGISFAGNNEVLTKDPISGIIYCSSASALGSVGSATINKLNPLTMTSAGTIVLPFVAIGKIGLKKAALIGDVRYYICEYDTATIHVMDGNFTEVDTIVVTPKTGVPIKVGACVYDETNELLIVRFSDVPNFVMNRVYIDVVIDANTKEIQNVLFPNGGGESGSEKGLNLNVYDGIYGYIYLGSAYIWEYVDRQNIVGQVILSSNPNYLFYWDILADLSLVESAFEMMIDGSPFGYEYAIYNNILEKLISKGSALANISFFDNNQVGYISQLVSNDGLIYLLTTDNGTEAIAAITDIVINAANGKFAVLGTSSPTAVGLAVFTNTTFVYLDCVPELDTSILTAGFNTDTGELWVLGVNGGLKTIAIYDTGLTLVSTFTISTGVGGTFEFIFDPQNNVMFLHHQGIGKVYIYQQNGTLTNTLNVTTKYPTLVGPNSSLRYYANGVSYGLIYESTSEEVHFFPIQLIDAGDYSIVGMFDYGVDAIDQLEDDECVTFEETETLIENATQMIINCNDND